jgi:DNA-binding transcriptional MocR family regulator
MKMLTSITTSPFTERLIHLMLVEGHYRKYLSRLHERLGEARINVVRAFERIGLELLAEPADGMFVWARFPHIDDSLALAEASQRDGIMLAPGTVFRPHLERARRGSGSTSPSAKTRECSAGCSGRRRMRRRNVACGGGGNST